jgi:hypothetical protein
MPNRRLSSTPDDSRGAPAAPEDLDFPLRRSVSMLKDDPEAAKAAFKGELASHCPHCGVKHRVITPDQCLDRRMSEKTLQARIVGRAKTRGWVIKHVGKGIAGFDGAGNPIFVSTAKNFPDLFMLHERQRRSLAIEVKRELGEFEPGQLEYLQLLNTCGIDAVVIRPSQLRDGTVNAILGPLE